VDTKKVIISVTDPIYLPGRYLQPTPWSTNR